jgi:hypothetical protein
VGIDFSEILKGGAARWKVHYPNSPKTAPRSRSFAPKRNKSRYNILNPSHKAAAHKGTKGKTMDNKSQDFVYATETLSDLIHSKLLNNKIESGNNVLAVEFSTLKEHAKMQTLLQHFDSEQYQIIYTNTDSATIIDKKTESYFKFYLRNKTVDFELFGDNDWILYITKYITEELGLQKFENHIKWFYSERGDNVKLPIYTNKLPVNEMYPFIGTENNSLEEYYKKYIESDSSVLVLIGPPGTGKTTFIKGLLHYAQASAILSYNSTVLSRDEIFVDFITDDEAFMIIEDCDTMLEDRSEGNTMMHRFLNISDGLVTVKGKKIIFTTNLPSVNSVDPALLRSGRCFDVLHFRELNFSEADTLAKKFNKELVDSKESYTVAEILGDKQENSDGSIQTKTIGFR